MLTDVLPVNRLSDNHGIDVDIDCFDLGAGGFGDDIAYFVNDGASDGRDLDAEVDDDVQVDGDRLVVVEGDADPLDRKSVV